jgi:hypothetical protein
MFDDSALREAAQPVASADEAAQLWLSSPQRSATRFAVMRCCVYRGKSWAGSR